MSQGRSRWTGAATLLSASLLGAVAPVQAWGRACQTWQVVPSPVITLATLQAVSGTSATDVWTVGSKYYSPAQPVILHWQGAGWKDTAKQRIDGDLYDVAAISPTDAWAVGQADNEYGPLAVHWDGTMWRNVSITAGGTYDQLFAVHASAANDIWAAGQFIHHWDGSSWSVAATPPGTIDALSGVSSDDVWAVGYEGLLPLAEHWDGTTWSVVPVPAPPSNGYVQLQSVAAFSSDDVWATGFAGGQLEPLIEHWDGAAWSIVSASPNSGLSLNAVAGTSSGDIWAVGGWRSVTLHWDGATWTPYGYQGPAGAYLTGVAAITSQDIWAVGSQTGPHGSIPLIEHSAGPCPGVP